MICESRLSVRMTGFLSQSSCDFFSDLQEAYSIEWLHINCSGYIHSEGWFYEEKAMAPHSSTLAWKIPWTEKPGMLQSTGSQSHTQLINWTKTPCIIGIGMHDYSYYPRLPVEQSWVHLWLQSPGGQGLRLAPILIPAPGLMLSGSPEVRDRKC